MKADARANLIVAAAALPLAILVLRPIIRHASTALNPFRFSDDVRVFVPAFYRDHGGLCRRDYSLNYVRDWSPDGFRVLYEMASLLGDPAALSKVLPYLLLIVLCVLVGASTLRIASTPTAICAQLLVCAAPIFLLQISGGLPRSFAYPIHALTVWGAVAAQPSALIAAAVLGVLFYPPASLLAGAVLTCLLLLPRSYRGPAEQWTLSRRVVTVAVTGVVCALLLVPSVMRTRKYGGRIGPHNRAQFPEMDRGGRVAGPDVPPYAPVTTATLDTLRSVFTGRGLLPERLSRYRIVAKVAIVLCGFGFLLLLKRSVKAQRLMMVAALGPVLHLIASRLDPYLYVPERFLAHLHVVMVVVIACGASALIQATSRVATSLAPIAAAALIVLTAGDFTETTRGLNIDASDRRPLMQFLARDPTVRLVAGWPAGPTDNVPYLARKPALLTFETHGAFHTGALLEKRRRMEAFLDAYYAGSLAPIVRLRNEFGVTHLIVNPAHFQDRRPSYFEPFRARIQALQATTVTPFTMRVENAVTFRSGDVFVIDLNRLGSR